MDSPEVRVMNLSDISPEGYEAGGALNIKAGCELDKFGLGTFKLSGSDCPILTDYEGLENVCRFCGKTIIQGKRKASYCRGRSHQDYESCFRKYWRHFEWQSASSWAMRRAEDKCENCGIERMDISHDVCINRRNLEVHHIVPLKGESRTFSHYNLPWNLIVLCHKCHLEIHAVMRPPVIANNLQDTWDEALKVGQTIMELSIK